MSLNTHFDEGKQFADDLVAEHARAIWNAAIEAAAKAAYDSEYVWDDKDVLLDCARSRILDLRR